MSIFTTPVVKILTTAVAGFHLRVLYAVAMNTYMVPIKKAVSRFGWATGDKITIEPGAGIRPGQIALLANGEYQRLTNDTALQAEPVALVTEWQRGLRPGWNYA